jgi:hypothetical protein
MGRHLAEARHRNLIDLRFHGFCGLPPSRTPPAAAGGCGLQLSLRGGDSLPGHSRVKLAVTSFARSPIVAHSPAH